MRCGRREEGKRRRGAKGDLDRLRERKGGRGVDGKREGGRERERERKRGRAREGEREGERERERETDSDIDSDREKWKESECVRVPCAGDAYAVSARQGFGPPPPRRTGAPQPRQAAAAPLRTNGSADGAEAATSDGRRAGRRRRIGHSDKMTRIRGLRGWLGTANSDMTVTRIGRLGYE